MDATVTIVTRDRVEEATTAIASVLKQQRCTCDIIVIDDGSTDRSAEQLRRRFPDITIYRSERPQGPSAQRNYAASVARGRYLIGIDDDAELTDARTIERTLADFAAGPDVGVVAIPYVEHLPDGSMLRFHHADGHEAQVVEQFVAAAYAVRLEPFLSVGGYRDNLYYYGEERDLSVRLLQAGQLVRLGTAPPLVHKPSPVRRNELRAFYGRRNDVLFAWQNVPTRQLPLRALRTTLNGILGAITIDGGAHLGPMLRGLISGWRETRHTNRDPLDPDTYRLSLELRRHGPISLPAVRAALDARRLASTRSRPTISRAAKWP